MSVPLSLSFPFIGSLAVTHFRSYPKLQVISPVSNIQINKSHFENHQSIATVLHHNV